MNEALQSIATNDAWAESVGTNSRLTRAALFDAFIFGAAANRDAKDAACAFACIISCVALTKGKNKVRMLRTLARAKQPGIDTALRFAAKMPARAREDSVLTAIGSFGAAVPDLIILVKAQISGLVNELIRVDAGIPLAFVSAEFSQLNWAVSCRSVIESIDRFLWESIVVDKRTKSRGTWSQSICRGPWDQV